MTARIRLRGGFDFDGFQQHAHSVQEISQRRIDGICIFMQTLPQLYASTATYPRLAHVESRRRHIPTRRRARTMLAKIIREQSVGRQAELVAMLRKHGHVATQSSVSRDLRELGVAKLGRRYVLPEHGDAGQERLFHAQAIRERACRPPAPISPCSKPPSARRRAWRWPSIPPAGPR